VNFASLNLSATDANQFTVTSYGTLKNQIIPLLIYNKRLGIKIANTSATVLLKTMSLAVLSIRLQTTLLEALVQLQA
jgi:hypothetical protein